MHKSIFRDIGLKASANEAISRVVDDFWRFPENRHQLNNLLVLIEGMSIRFELKIKNHPLAFKKYVEFRDAGLIDVAKSVLLKEELEVVMEIVEDIERVLNLVK